MKVFEIIFILLLMIPVALLMRFLISRLSAQKPKQVRKPSDAQEVSVRALRSRRQKKKADEIKKEKRKKKEEPPPQEPKPAAPNIGFVPRTPVQQRRSERVPFSEVNREPEKTSKDRSGTGRRITPRQRMTIVQTPQAPTKSAPAPAAESKPAPAAETKPKPKGLFSRKTVVLNTEEIKSKIQEQGKKQPRSEQKPTRRQKRRQRERSRKRRLSRTDNNDVQ